MPQRFLRPGITTSDAWNSCGWQAQSLYVRILTLVDDWGRYDARIPILHAHCFALRTDVKAQQTAGFRSELQRTGLIVVYVVDGKEYLQVTKWQERTRGAKSKYPDPTDENTCPQDSAADGSGPQEKDASLATTPNATTPSSIAIAPTQPVGWSKQVGWFGITDELRKQWADAYPACDIGRQLLAMQEWLRANPTKATKSNWLKFITNWLARQQDKGGDAPRNVVGATFKRQEGTSLRQEQLDRIPVWTP